MTQSPTIILHTKDVELEEPVQAHIERRCQNLADEFSEVTRVELAITQEGASFEVHGHATGKNTDVATAAEASEPGPAADMVLEAIARQLRKVHDKRIFAQRRKAQRDPPKRKTGA